MAIQPHQENGEVSTPIKRIRWATQRVTGESGRRKRISIMQRLHKRTGSLEQKRGSGGSESADGSHTGTTSHAGYEDEDEDEQDDPEDGPRRIFFNRPLPKDAKDEEGHPLHYFGSNKVRTAKYTPLSFVPKNLFYQFHNIANIYFLFIIILAFFPIFGGSNPGLGSVPLMVILFVTAVKDAIEDYRRTILDDELNNSPVHRLVDWENVNTIEDTVGLWRRIKKATSRGIRSMIHWLKHRRSRTGREGRSNAERTMTESHRASIGTRATHRLSVQSAYSARNSLQAAEHPAGAGVEAIPMTPVPSITPGRDRLSIAGATMEGSDRPDTAFSHTADDTLEPSKAKRGSRAPPNRTYGSLIDPRKDSGQARFKKDRWKSVQVGDFVRIYNDDQIPADVVILSTSDQDGACYVETKNLDGETNLKVRQALHSGRQVKHARDCERTDFVIESEAPHANLYQYSGTARWTQQSPTGGEPTELAEPISIHNLLLRGCSLRNTDWVLGVVVFTGQETKIMVNAGMTPSKRSRIARDLNWNVIYNFVILFIMCFISGVVQGVTWAHGHNSLDYFEWGGIGSKPSLDGFITFWTALILFQNLVPISLYISLEIIKTIQAFFIYSDTHMYYEPIDYPCTPKSWNISDDLGQIEYIFSDKTGTLTQNVMEFKKCTIHGVPYGEAYTEAQAGLQKRQGIDIEVEGVRAKAQIAEDRVRMLEEIRRLHVNPYLDPDGLTFVAPDFVRDLAGDAGEEQRRANEHFMLALALCHTVITERTEGETPRIEFRAQSPDEAALVATARDCGFTVIGRTADAILLNIMGVERAYQVLNTLEFNSTRKRMSAIIRMPDDGRIVLFCKGADSIIYSRLQAGEQPELRATTAEHLEMFAREGLRTLCVAERELSEELYQAWSKEHDVAANAVLNREEKLEAVSDRIERELILLGGTAIEDRLQEGVPDTISLLAEAGIKLWVLTGDKVETAINIGFSCNLLSNDMDLIVFNIADDRMESAEAELDCHLETFGLTGSDAELMAARKNHEPPAPTHAIVIDGDSLKLVLEPRLRQKFLLLCKQCRSVLCCRVSPSQKAAVVQMVKTGLNVMTLSVGDGANDVAMIQEADVGVGIAGEEGRQAVMSSDYAIGQFRFLQRLILVHGRWSYRRLGETIANFFYKTIVWTFALFWYQLYNSFDGTYLFDYSYILFYNVAFTSLPIILMGTLDQDVSDRVSLAVPQLYRRGIERKEWTQTKFWIYMVDGVYQSLVCFYITYLLFAPAVHVTDSGHDVSDTNRMGVYVACGTIAVSNVYVLLNTYRWDWLTVLLVAISVLLIFVWTGVYSSFLASDAFYHAARECFGQPSFWAITLLTIIIALLPRFTAKAFQKLFRPRDVDIVREQVRQGRWDHLGDPAPEAESAEYVPPSSSKLLVSAAASASGMSLFGRARPSPNMADDERPMYPPSMAPTVSTHHLRGQNGSVDSNALPRRDSLEQPAVRQSFDRPRPSFDRMRSSMDRIRPSFEASNDFTSASLLTRIESSHCRYQSRRTNDITEELR